MSISVRRPRITGIDRAITKIESSVQSCPVGLPVSVVSAAYAATGRASVRATAVRLGSRRRTERDLRRIGGPERTIHDGGGGRNDAAAGCAPRRGGACPAVPSGRRRLRVVRPSRRGRRDPRPGVGAAPGGAGGGA